MVRVGKPGRLIDLARKRGVISPADAEELGIDRLWLARLTAAGRLERVARGRYRLADGEVSEHHTLAVAASLAPTAVICLLSALQYHQIGVQSPAEVWIALERGAWRPTLAYPPLRVVHVSGAAFTAGVEHHVIEGVRVPIYSVAKTIADCFKFRNRIGLDVALEALTDAWRQRKFTLAELSRFAAINRVQRTMQPYIEAIIQ
jgi:predicted transcriptional regulator of viral defense system